MESEGAAGAAEGPGGAAAVAEDGQPAEPDISHAPVNVLFNTSSIAKADVWDIDLIKILELLMSILERSGKKDLRVAGMAALSSSLIYRMKVDRIFALHREAMEKKPLVDRRDVDIAMLDIPYRHEPTRPVSLDELLGILESLITTIANPKSRRGRLVVEADPEPKFEDYFIALENVIGKYETLVLSKLRAAAGGSGLLGDMTAGLGDIDAVRCFLAVLFLARDERVDLAQEGDDIRVTLMAGPEAAPRGGNATEGAAAAEIGAAAAEEGDGIGPAGAPGAEADEEAKGGGMISHGGDLSPALQAPGGGAVEEEEEAEGGGALSHGGDLAPALQAHGVSAEEEGGGAEGGAAAAAEPAGTAAAAGGEAQGSGGRQ